MGCVHSAVTAACHAYFERFRRHVYVTPRSYLAFLSGFRELYSRKLGATRELASSINSGLAKMNEAKVDVNRMKARARMACACMCCSCAGTSPDRCRMPASVLIEPQNNIASSLMHECWQMCSLRCHNSHCACLQGELAIKNADLAVAARSVEEMLKEISQSTAAAEKEKSKVAVIVDDVSKTASACGRILQFS